MYSAPGRAGDTAAVLSIVTASNDALPRFGGGIVLDETSSHEQMAIVEKYERVIEYLYPIIQTMPRKHAIARDQILLTLFAQVDLFIIAGKSKQASRLYSADANLALLRYWLRFMAHPSRRFIPPKKQGVALGLIAEVGNMLGTWIKSAKRGG